MRERPILFSAPMVRAIIDGSKTQTRRSVKPQPYIDAQGNFCWSGKNFGQNFNGPCVQSIASPLPSSRTGRVHCPYGKPGDRLWVRETCRAEELPDGIDGVRYVADNEFIPIENTECAAERWVELGCYGMKFSGRPECRKVPSIHMPRWAARILLEITSVRVERLNDISEADAIAEGVNVHPYHYGKPRDSIYGPVQAYRDLWESINGPGNWDENPWVWVVEFKRLDISK